MILLRNAKKDTTVNCRFGKRRIWAGAGRQGLAPQVPESAVTRRGDFERLTITRKSKCVAQFARQVDENRRPLLEIRSLE
jgi:hypothetical protein